MKIIEKGSEKPFQRSLTKRPLLSMVDLPKIGTT